MSLDGMWLIKSLLFLPEQCRVCRGFSPKREAPPFLRRKAIIGTIKKINGATRDLDVFSNPLWNSSGFPGFSICSPVQSQKTLFLFLEEVEYNSRKCAAFPLVSIAKPLLQSEVPA